MSVIFYGQEIYAGVHPCLHAWAGSWLHRWNWVGVRLGNHWDGRSHRWHAQVLDLVVMWCDGDNVDAGRQLKQSWATRSAWPRKARLTALPTPWPAGTFSRYTWSASSSPPQSASPTTWSVEKRQAKTAVRVIVEDLLLSRWIFVVIFADGKDHFFFKVEGSHHLVGVVSWGFGCAVVCLFFSSSFPCE